MLLARVIEAYWRSMRRSWIAEAVPSVAQPVILMAVFAGLLARQVSEHVSDWGAPATFGYAQYAAIGIACSSGVLAGAMEATHSAYSGFRFNEKFKTIVTTPVSARVLALGLLSVAFIESAALTAALLLLATPVLAGSGLVWLLPFMLVSGLACTAVSAALCAIIALHHKTPQILNITGRVALFPLMLFSATYFPSTVLPGWLRYLPDAFPLIHANVTLRALYAGHWRVLPVNLAVLVAWSVVGGSAMIWAFGRELHR